MSEVLAELDADKTALNMGFSLGSHLGAAGSSGNPQVPGADLHDTIAGRQTIRDRGLGNRLEYPLKSRLESRLEKGVGGYHSGKIHVADGIECSIRDLRNLAPFAGTGARQPTAIRPVN